MIQIKKFQLKNKNIEQSSDRIMKQTVRRIIHQMQKKKKKKLKESSKIETCEV